MAPRPVKKYTITGSRWSNQRLEIQQDGVPVFFVNANNKYGPWKDPYVTIHEEHQSGEIVAAAKMGPAGWARDFKIWLGNPDCTDLNTWSVVKCKGKSAFEYRFRVGMQEFSWRRTRDRQLGAQRKGHRDFKLVAFDPPEPDYRHSQDIMMDGEKCSLDMEDEKIEERFLHCIEAHNKEIRAERVVAIYYLDTHFKSNSREAKINFFEELPKKTELWCLAAVLGLQEKISKNQDVLLLSSFGYGGGLWWLGNYI